MRTKRVFSCILLIISLVSFNFSSLLVLPVTAQDISQFETTEEVSVYRVYYGSADDIQKLMAFDLFEFNNLDEKYVLVAVNQAELEQIQKMGFSVQFDKEETENYELLFLFLQNQLQTIPGYACYRTVEETFAAAAGLAGTHPNLATWIDVGDSWEKSVGQPVGYDMHVLKLTNAAIPGEKPKLFVTAAIHAREYTTAELATRFAEYLVNNYNVDPDATWLLDYHEIHLMLQTNPDGRKEAESGLSWRKNTNENYCGVTSTSRGADLNRNYSFYWNSCSGCSSGNPCDATYRGPSPASEPEVQAVQTYMRSIFPDQRDASLGSPAPSDAMGIFIDLHSYSELVLWPWGMTSSLAPNNSGLQTLGRKFAFFNNYTPQRSYQLYGTDGDSVDFAYGDLGIAAYTFELGTRFFEYCSTFEGTILPTNLQALIYAAKVASTPYMTPAGPDSLNLALSASTVPAGTSVTLTATANDTRYKSGSGEPTQAIAAGEYYIDTPPWVTGATAFPMSASDGTFNSTTENITATLNTTGWSQGRHTLFLRSRDAAGNWGAVSAVFLTVIVTDNEPPVADDQEISTVEDTAVSIALSGSDPDDNPLTFSVVDGPASGTLSGTAPDLTYTPGADYNGLDSFTYKANDGIADSELATVSITITPVNDAPVAQNQSLSTEVNSPLAIELAGLDVDGDSLTFTVLADPEYGSLSGTAPSLQYTPVAGYTGSDSFTYSVNDGTLDSEIATISITITPPGPVQVFWDDFESDLGWVVDPNNNDTATLGIWERANPESTDSSGSVMQLGETVSGTHDLVTGYLAGSGVGSYDVDSGDTTILSPEISLPAGRELTLSVFYYLAHLNNATADDYLRVSVLGETSQLVFEELGGANTDVATWESFSADISSYSGQTIRLLIEAADAGTASLVEAAIDDVLIQGLMTNNPPSADSQSVVTDEDMAVGVTLSGSDPEGAPLTYTVVTQPLHGSLSGTAPELTYMPDANYNGPDSFTFKVNDGTVDSNTATVTITVTPVNDVPVADDQSVITAEDTAKSITLAGTDVDGNSLTYTIVTQPAHGSLSGDVLNVTYTPTTNFNGSDSFSFKVNDGSVDSNVATVSITVTAVNDAPVADSQSVETAEDTATAITLTGSDIESSSLTFNIVNQPANGTLSGSAPNLTYTPSADYHGSDSFTFRVSDGQTNSATATVNISITPVNDAPVAQDQNIGTTQDTPVDITLSGSDIDADPLTYAVSTSPTNGTLSGTAPNLTYTPDSGYVGADSFEFTVSDGIATSSAATVSISVSNINDAPEATGQTLSTPEDTSLSITLTGSDADGDSLTYSIVAQPLHGDVSGTAPELTYTPDANYNGPDSFTFKVNDGEADSNIATVTITVTPVNDAPVAEEQSVSTTEDAARTIVLVGTDADGDALTYRIVTGPSHGSLSGTGSIKTYTPAANFNGSDSFTFKVNDGNVDSSTATISITVTAVNDSPVAIDQEISTAEDASKAITLSGSDADNDPITYRVITQPAHGSLTGTAPVLTYAPEANYNGTDSFTFVANDGTIDSAPATVTIDITPVNDAPIANGQAVVTSENTAVEITLTGTDVEGSELTFSIQSGPSNGTLPGYGAARTYQPAAGYEGEDSFTFIANDGELNSEPATVSITITRTNEPPVANGQTVTTGEDVALGVTLTGSDPDNDPITYVVSADPSHGTLSGTAPNLTYTPDGNYHGPDSFSFVVNDGLVDSAEATIAITVLSVNDAPVAEPQSVTVVEDIATDITLSGSDIDGDALTYTIVTGPAHGSLSGTGSIKTYTPAANYNGTDTFTFKANDGTIDSSIATVTITVTAVNDAPFAINQSVNTAEDTAKPITLSGSDPEGAPLTYTVVTQPLHGDLSDTAPELTYTPDANYYGPDSFTFKVNDGTVDSNTATVTITVTPVNDAPLAEEQSVSTAEDTAKAITLTGTDVDHDTLTYSIVSQPAHGTLNVIGPDVSYTPAANYNGSDSFTFKVNDGTIDSNIATVTITVTAVNDAPVADSQSVNTAEDIALDITLTGSDVELNPLTYSIVTSPTHGTLSGIAPDVTYTPTANYNGPDSFTFRVYDGQANSVPATVSITIAPVNDAPIAFAQSVSVHEDASVDIVLAGSDVDGDGLTFAVVTGPAHGALSGTVPNLRYTPVANYNGDDAFTFTVSDGTLVSTIAVVEVTIRPVNDLPVAEGQAVTTSENTPVAITLEGSDVDGDALTYIINDGPAHGVLTGTLPNLTYTPFDYYSGTDVFSFYVNDGISNSNSADVTILILDINYLPIVYNQTVSTSENSPLAILLTGMDPDGDVLSFFTITPPEHGILSGTAPNLVYTPNPGYTGSDSFTFAASDQDGESNEGVVSIQVTPSGPLTVFFDDFETNLGWVRNAYGTDTATLGWFERANPEGVAYYGDKQLGTTVSGSYDLVTGPLAGYSAGSYDLDGGKTSMLSPVIELPVGRDLELSFSYYVAHYTNSSTADYLRVYIIGENTVRIFEELGANNDDDAVWEVFNGNISSFAGQNVQILIEAADASTASYFEAAVDDILIEATTPNNPPFAESQSYEMAEDTNLELTLAGSDPNGDVITFLIETPPSHGSLSGTLPNLVYTPDSNYNGIDSFTYVVNDGMLDSEPATISLTITPVNDAPQAIAQTVSTSMDTRLDITLAGTDVDGDGLQFNITSFPTVGILGGYVPNMVYIPLEGYIGEDSFTFVVFDGVEESLPATVNISVNPAGPMTVFWDDFETDQGWIFDPFGTDTASVGTLERANPETVIYNGDKQLGTTASGFYDLVTGPLAGGSAGDYDLDGGVTTVRSPNITLPSGRDLILSFSYYFAHASNSSLSDYLRVRIVGSTTLTLFQEVGARNDDDASWETFSVSLDSFAGQTVYLIIDAADGYTASFVEAAIDDVLIIAE